jgi:hypothetical protein
VDYLQRRQTCAFNQRRNVFTEQLFGLGRPRAIQGVSAPARISPRTRSTSGLRVTGLSRLSILSIQPLLCRLCRRFVYLRLLAIQGLIRHGMTNVEVRMTNQVPKEAIPNARQSLAHLSTGPLDHSALPLHIVICPPEPDLLIYLQFPWSGRPRDCLGASVCRTAARYANPFNYCYLKPNDDSNGFWNDFWNRKRLRLR